MLFVNFLAFEDDGFGENPLFHAFVAVEKSTNSIVGCAVFVFTYATFTGKCMFMEDLFVQPAHRNHGIGLGLFNLVAKVLFTAGKASGKLSN